MVQAYDLFGWRPLCLSVILKQHAYFRTQKQQYQET